MHTQRGILGNILIALAILSLIIFSLFPVVQLLSVSFKPNNEWGNVNIIPKQPILTHYKEVLGITPSGAEARKIEFTKQLNVEEAKNLSPEFRTQLIDRVNLWVDETANSEDFIGNFKELRNNVRDFRKEIRTELEAQGLSAPAANSIVTNGIDGPVPYRALGTLTLTDKKPEKQREILAEFNKEGVNFLNFFKNSFLFSTISSVVSVFLAIFGSYALARLNFFGRETISKTVLLTYMVGGILLLVPLFQMANQLGFLETPYKRAIFVLAIYIMQTLPVSLYMLGNYFRTISFSLEEAAAVDGYGRLETIFRVVLPLSLPMVATVFVYCFVIAWNEYLFMASFLKEYSSFWTLPIALNELTASANDIKGKISAASILTLLPVIILFGYAMRHITGGLSEGGVKE